MDDNSKRFYFFERFLNRIRRQPGHVMKLEAYSVMETPSHLTITIFSIDFEVYRDNKSITAL
jgi:hypothetical protein